MNSKNSLVSLFSGNQKDVADFVMSIEVFWGGVAVESTSNLWISPYDSLEEDE